MAEIKEVKKTAPKGHDQRGRSQIACPYFDLDQSIKVAETIYTKGGGSCTHDQLAHWLDYASTRSGTYLTRISAAKQYGLIESSGGSLSVTERAKLILAPVMPNDAINAKVEAFLSVPLFSKVFEQFRGNQLPPEVGLKNLFHSNFKIVTDRVLPSVRVFLKAAEQAGMLAGSGDKLRLIRPSVSGATQPPPEERKDEKPPERPKGSGEGPPGGIHTAIVGILRELPPTGTPYPPAKKQRFLDAFKAILDVVYPESEDSQ